MCMLCGLPTLMSLLLASKEQGSRLAWPLPKDDDEDSDCRIIAI